MAERPHKLRFRVLLARDLTAETATQLAELYVPQDPCFDLCLLCGPFTHKPLITSEDHAVAEGDMALMIAQIENIVCRVCYLASADDPPSTREKQLHLTPNSVNIHGRTMLLADNLAIGGYAHPEPYQVSVDSDDEDVADGPRLHDVVSTQQASHVHSIVVQQGGKYIPAVAELANLCLYVCCDDDTASVADGHARIRSQGNVVVVHPPSLRRTRRYIALGLQEEENGWVVTSTEERELVRRPVSVATLAFTAKSRSH